ncbi:MAG: hypothetical protein ACOC23_08780 [Thermodesulfobacteriota bacterium]
MKFDIRINNIFWKTVEGKTFEAALQAEGLDYDFRSTWEDENCGILEMDELPEGGVDIEIRDSVQTSGELNATWGPEE